MPMFFILSGYCFSEENLKIKSSEFIRKKLKAYIKPYFIMAFMNLILWVPVEYITEGKIRIINYILGIAYSRGSRQWMPNCSPLWFLTCAFVVLILFREIEKIKARESVKALIVFGCMLVSYGLNLFNIPKLPWNIDTALMGIGFVYTGYQLRQLNIMEKMESWSRTKIFTTVTLLTVIGFAAVYFNGICVNFDGNIYGNLGYMLAGAFSLGFMTILLSYRLGQSENGFCRLIIFLGRNTLPVLGFNYFMNGVFKVFWQLTPWLTGRFPYWLLQFIFVTAGLAAIIVLQKILEKEIKKWRLNYV